MQEPKPEIPQCIWDLPLPQQHQIFQWMTQNRLQALRVSREEADKKIRDLELKQFRVEQVYERVIEDLRKIISQCQNLPE